MTAFWKETGRGKRPGSNRDPVEDVTLLRVDFVSGRGARGEVREM